MGRASLIAMRDTCMVRLRSVRCVPPNATAIAMTLSHSARAFAASCAALMVAAAATAAAAPIETLLYSFGAPLDGVQPRAGLIADSAGNLYGTTADGGAFGRGTVFRVTPSGTETTLHSFAGPPDDGALPLAGLVADSAGNLYGTTIGGGAFEHWGTVFKVTQSGTETVLHSFAAPPYDGIHPTGGLIADSAGNLYGTTSGGGVFFSGTIFKLTPSGTENVLYSFGGLPDDGSMPMAGLIADSAGNLYGTTAGGGAFGYGTVFELTPSGTESVLHSFAGPPNDGSMPMAGLIADSAGNLYGTTVSGGASCPDEEGCGTVYKLTAGGTETVLYSFTGPFSADPGEGDGANPDGALISDSAGNLYGTTGNGDGDGIVFKLTPSGMETVLSFFEANPHNNTTGSHPFAGLTADSAGSLYGTTVAGGTSGDGTVFKLTGTGFVTPLAALLTEVTGVGPGTSLADKVTLAQTYHSANDIPNTCSTLTALVNEVTAQERKKISQSAGGQIIADAATIKAAIGCP